MNKTRQNLFVRLLRRKFFNKVLLTYATIILIAMSILTTVVSQNVSDMILQREAQYNRLIVRNLNIFMDQKCRLIKKILQKTYLDSYIMPELTYFFDTDYDKSSVAYLILMQRFKEYFLSVFLQDAYISRIILYKKIDGSIYYFSKNTTAEYNESEFAYPERLDKVNDDSYRLDIYPYYYPVYKYDFGRDEMAYTISINIRKLGTTVCTGVLMIDFDQAGITSYLSQFNNDVNAQFLILTKGGEVVYDSAGGYGEGPFHGIGNYGEGPFHNAGGYGEDAFQNAGDYGDDAFHGIGAPDGKIGFTLLNGEEYMVNTESDDSSGLTIMSFVPKKDILKNIAATKSTIYTVSLASVFSVLALTYIGTKVFARRLEIIAGAMKKLRAGDFTVTVPANEAGDEIDNIAVNFNEMGKELNEYINKVYVSGIKQKNAEMTALQAQINPHFLYNTLEAIRMSAVSSGDNDTSRMIYLLSRLFRNSAKGESIITIEDELNYSKLYLELFKIRFGDNLSITFEIDEGILGYGIIKHLIQPVIENYVVHGFDAERRDNCIHVRGLRRGEYIQFVVADNGKGMEAEQLASMKLSLKNCEAGSGNGIGLNNINERIKLAYGTDCGVNIFSGAEGAESAGGMGSANGAGGAGSMGDIGGEGGGGGTAGAGTVVTISILAKSKDELENMHGAPVGLEE